MPTGMVTSYDLTVGVVVNMDEAIYMLSPVDTPFLTGLGADGLLVIGTESVDERQFSWMSDEILTPRSKLGAALTTAETVVTVATGDRLKFSTGDLLSIEKKDGDEVIRVTGYGTTTDTLTVTRTFAGTSVNYANGAIVMAVGTALAEGSEPETARSRDRVEHTNVTQIFGPTKVHMSRTEQQVRKYGVQSEWAYQLANRIKENAISREQAFLYGQKVDDTTNERRSTGGLNHFITTVKDTTSTQLTVSAIQSNQQTGYNNGGFADVVFANPAALIDLNEVTNTSIVRETLDDPRRGRVRVSFVDTEFGSVLIARNRWVKHHDAFGISRENVRRRVLQPLVFERIGKKGDFDEAFIVAEEGLEVKGQQHLFKMVNLGYTTGN